MCFNEHVFDIIVFSLQSQQLTQQNYSDLIRTLLLVLTRVCKLKLL